MAISRAQLLKELLPGLNALFGMEYKRYGEEHKEIYETETSERSFEEETKLSGFGAAPVKNEGSAIAYDNAQEAFTSRYTHEIMHSIGLNKSIEATCKNLGTQRHTRFTPPLLGGREAIGMGFGSLVGLVAGGPVGAAIGAALGFTAGKISR